MRILQLFFLLSIVLFTSCSKSNPTSATQSKLVGKWTLKSFTAKDFLGSQPRTTSGNYKPGEYIQMEADGTCYFRVDDAVTKTTWKLLNNDKTLFFENAGNLDVAEAGYEIADLDNNHLELYAQEGTGQNKAEVTIRLEK